MAVAARDKKGAAPSAQAVQAQITEVYKKLAGCQKRVPVLVGGAGSSKSHSIGQWYLKVFVEQPQVKMAVMRKTLPSLRRTAYDLMLTLFKEYGIYHLIEHDRTNLTFGFNGATMSFLGLDDPEKIKCFHPDTEILTANGWKQVAEIKQGELVATMAPQTGVMTYAPVANTYVYQYKGPMYSPVSATGKRSPHVDFCVTPEHKIIADGRICEAHTLKTQFKVPVSALYQQGLKPKWFCLGKGISWHNRNPRNHPKSQRSQANPVGRKTRVFPMISWLKFLGWYLSEGSIYSTTVVISQTKPEGRAKIVSDLRTFPYSYCNGELGFTICGKDLVTELATYGHGSHNKRIPRYVFSLHPDLLRHLFDSLIAGDGTHTSSTRMVYCTASIGLADDVAELATLLGYSTTKHYVDTTNSWQVYITQRSTSEVYKLAESPYDGPVFCVEVPPCHTVLQRFHGKTMWIGQSANFNYIWMEEATDFDYEDFLQATLRLRAPAPKDCSNKIVLSLNPIDANCWVATKIPQRDDVEIIHSTYKDNPFLDKDYIKSLEDLINQDENYYRVYVLGEWGRLENLIFTRYKQVPQIPQGCKWVYGLDFGYTHPMALVKVAMSEDGKVYLEERLHKSKMTGADLVEFLSHEEKADIFADSARPELIEELNRAGYRAYPANKSVKYGIDLMKRQELNVTESSSNTWKQLRGYCWRKDKNGVVLEEPVKFNDDAVDSCRYGLAGLVERYGAAVAQGSHSYGTIKTLHFAGRR